MGAPLFFAGQPGIGYGWGTANSRLLASLKPMIELVHLSETHPLWHSQKLRGDLFVPIMDHWFNPAAPCRGRRNFAYSFFEFELPDQAIERAMRYDLVFAGSSWCVNQLRKHGVHHARLLVQRVDGITFFPGAVDDPSGAGGFRLFSGGKLELRKGQDLVIAAFRELQHRLPALRLVTAWFNLWPDTISSLACSPYIRFEWIDAPWQEQVRHLLRINDIDPARVDILPLLSPEKLAEVYRSTDAGLFPNRCEGGTNLVMMEYMACGKPVVGSYTSGHQDVLTPENSIRICELEDLEISDPDSGLVGLWRQPTVPSLVQAVERLYQDRALGRRLGLRAAAGIRAFGWDRCARELLEAIGQA